MPEVQTARATEGEDDVGCGRVTMSPTRINTSERFSARPGVLRDVELSAMDRSLSECPFCGYRGKVFRLQWGEIDCPECGLRDVDDLAYLEDDSDEETDPPPSVAELHDSAPPTPSAATRTTRSLFNDAIKDSEPDRPRRKKKEFAISEACFDRLPARRGEVPKLIRRLITAKHTYQLGYVEQIPYGEPKRKIHMRFTESELEILDSQARLQKRDHQLPVTRGEIIQALLEEFALAEDP
ncbi:MAG: hypothetical protein KC800_05615 [Candidatus Eremiobacteraeota bacterium]|nr:hypothetical protein [Candidatus Eremiobacteraeota bacterium]